MILHRPILLLTLTCLLAACGQRGPLFLPEESAAPAASRQAPDEPDEEPGDDSEDHDDVHVGGFEDGQADET